MGGDFSVEILQQPIEDGCAECARVSVKSGGMWAQGAFQVECSTIVSFTKTSGQYEDFSIIAHGESAHGLRLVMLGGCVNKAIGLFNKATNEP